MNDTSPAINNRVIELLKQKSPEERVKMGCSMHDFSKLVVSEAIRQEHPELSPQELRQRIFLRFYGDDFSPTERESILEHLKNN